MLKENLLKIMLVGIIVVVICLLGIYLYHENTSLQVNPKIITNSKLPEKFSGYKIAHISDFHNTTSKRLASKLVQEIKNNDVDIIVITGDLIDSRRTNTKVAIEFVSELVKITKVYYVPGNHESRIAEYASFKKNLANLGVNVLENKVLVLTNGDEQINLIGIKDPAFFYEYSVDDSEIIKKEIQDLKYSKDIFTILLSHRPEVFEAYVEKDIDLVFTGHAHGGQIRLPFVGGIIAPVQGFFPKYTEGVHKDKNTTMIISRGIGNSLFPFRVNNRPELIIVELNK